MKPMLMPERDLNGATPETLARTLMGPHHAGKPIIGDKTLVEKPSADKPGDGLAQLINRY